LSWAASYNVNLPLLCVYISSAWRRGSDACCQQQLV